MKILVVDDDPNIIDLVSTRLKKDNFIIDVAEDGDEAFEKAKSKQYEAIILDLMMPAKHGSDVIKGLRTLGIDTPILVISGQTLIQEKINTINIGADDYLVKTFLVDELAVRIKALIRRNARRTTNVLHCDNLRINLADMSVHRGLRPIYLSSKELGLLVILLQNKDKIVRREKLIESVWDKGIDTLSSNTLDVHIRLLRKKIAEPGEKKSLIKTFRLNGYMLSKNNKK